MQKGSVYSIGHYSNLKKKKSFKEITVTQMTQQKQLIVGYCAGRHGAGWRPMSAGIGVNVRPWAGN